MTVTVHIRDGLKRADGTPLNDYWRSGLRFESANKNFSIFIGGRFQFDVVDYITTRTLRQNIPGNVPLEAGASFRRIRFDMGGTLYKNFEYFAQVDFINGFVTSDNRQSDAPAPTDMWIQLKDLPYVGSVRSSFLYTSTCHSRLPLSAW